VACGQSFGRTEDDMVFSCSTSGVLSAGTCRRGIFAPGEPPFVGICETVVSPSVQNTGCDCGPCLFFSGHECFSYEPPGGSLTCFYDAATSACTCG
jgi:hypothetical protein